MLNPTAIGWLGTMKAAVNTGLALLGALVLAAFWEQDLAAVSTLKTLGSFTGLAFAISLLVEWMFRGWHKEQADRTEKALKEMGTVEDASRAAAGAVLADIRRVSGGTIVLQTNHDGVVIAAGPAASAKDVEPTG